MQGVKTCLAFLAAFCLLGACCVGLLCVLSGNTALMSALFTRLDTPTAAGLSPEDGQQAAQVITDYLRGEQDALHLQAAVYGHKQEVFEERSALHMADVRTLVALGRRVALIFFGVFAALSLALILLRAPKPSLGKGLLLAVILWIVLLLLICAACLTNFTMVFTLFHQAFFHNDLWLLNPATSALIRLMPESLFIWYGGIYGALCALLFALGAFTARALRRQHDIS